MADTITLVFNIAGDANTVVANLHKNFGNLQATISKTTVNVQNLAAKFIVFQQATQLIDGFRQSITAINEPGKQLNSSLADLAAISGVAGNGLKEIEGYARSSAKVFGGSAAQSVESYKLLLSQLSPELAKYPKALQEMGSNIAVLSKTMGGDTTAAAEVLTTAMNQYGVSLKDPTEASRKMAEMMNVMAAAGKEGSAELPAIKMALQEAGMAAKAANISFEETNSAIQVLDKAGKKGAEGGVAIRNIISILSQGRFLPQDVIKGLSNAGINAEKLGDKSLTLSDRLRMLRPVLNDSALFVKLFGRENSNAALALVQGTDEMDRYRTAIFGTNTAVEQANIIMETYAEKQSRIKAHFDDLKISLFNVTGSFGIWVSIIGESLIPLAQLYPLISATTSVFLRLKTVNIALALSNANIQMAMMNENMKISQLYSLGFVRNIGVATLAVFRFGTVGVWNAIKGIGALIASLVTGGATSATFAAISSGAFAVFSTAARIACRAVAVAIFNIPILGWIALAITGLSALFIWLYNKFDKFRAFMNGIGAAIKAIFTGGSVKDAFRKAYDDTLDEAKKAKAEKELGVPKGSGIGIPPAKKTTGFGNVPPAAVSAASTTVSGGSRNTAITINAKDMVKINVAGGLGDSVEDIRAKITDAMYKVLYSVEAIG